MLAGTAMMLQFCRSPSPCFPHIFWLATSLVCFRKWLINNRIVCSHLRWATLCRSSPHQQGRVWGYVQKEGDILQCQLPLQYLQGETCGGDVYNYTVYIQTYIHRYKNTYLHTSIHAYIHYIHTYIHYITWHYMTWHDITLHDITLHYITLHYITYIHTYITSHYITLHYITYIHTYIHTYTHTHIHTYIHTYITLHYIHNITYKTLHT